MAPRARVMLISLWVALCIATGCSHAPPPSPELDRVSVNLIGQLTRALVSVVNV